MKITFLVTELGWHSKQLIKEAKKRKINLNIINRVEVTRPFIEKFHNIIFWKSCPIKNKQDRETFKKLLKKSGKNIINDKKNCRVSSKKYQQKILSGTSLKINTIPTFSFSTKEELINEISNGDLTFPFIKKPDTGSQGKNISLIKKFSDIKNISDKDMSKFIFQPFIKNSGDYRVLVLGGKALGAIKRTAKKGNFLNNISQGGKAKKVQEKEVFSELSKIAVKAASVFNLTFCGIDIILNEKDKKFYFMEINTVPEWRGFQKTTKINVAGLLIDFCLLWSEREQINFSKAVKNYYEKNFDFLGNHKFHYATRMWLWSKDKKFKKRLLKLKSIHFNKYKGGISGKIKTFLNEDLKKASGARNYKERLPYLKKYHPIYNYQKILFFYLFSKTIYRKDIRRYLIRSMPYKKIEDLKNKLQKDKAAILTLSTFAVNYIYLSNYYLNKENEPWFFLEIAEKAYKNKLSLNDVMYLLSHCIIGESAFYSKKIEKNIATYKQMLDLMEEIIKENFNKIDLDIKFEFLVCAKLLNTKSVLEKNISEEAKKSFSPVGNFLVDMHNSNKENLQKNNLLISEHRNVLFLMANRECRI